MAQFTLSLEPRGAPSAPLRYLLPATMSVGTARLIAETRFRSGRWRTVALLQNGRIYDVFDGEWASESAWDANFGYGTTQEVIES